MASGEVWPERGVACAYLLICRCFLRRMSRKRTRRPRRRRLRMASAEMAATLGFISLASHTHKHSEPHKHTHRAQQQWLGGAPYLPMVVMVMWAGLLGML